MLRIWQGVDVSRKDIGTICRKYAGEGEESPYLEKGSACNSAFKLFKEGKILFDTAIAPSSDTMRYWGSIVTICSY
jgi:hypothetical protein